MTPPRTYEQGLEDGRQEQAENLRRLKEELTKALTENLSLRDQIAKRTHP